MQIGNKFYAEFYSELHLAGMRMEEGAGAGFVHCFYAIKLHGCIRLSGVYFTFQST